MALPDDTSPAAAEAWGLAAGLRLLRAQTQHGRCAPARRARPERAQRSRSRRPGGRVAQDPEELRASLDADTAMYDYGEDPAGCLGDVDELMGLLRDPFMAPRAERFVDGSVHLWGALKVLGWPLDRLWRAVGAPESGICVPAGVGARRRRR